MTYQSRNRGVPNVSQYLANLNAINPSLSSPEAVFDEIIPSDDLSLFVNAQFFDFDKAGGEMDNGNNDGSLDQRRDGSGVKDEGNSNLDFLMNDFDFNQYIPNLNEEFGTSFPQSSAQNQSVRQQPQIQQSPQTPSIPSHSQSPQQPTPTPQQQLKSNSEDDVSLEDASRLAAEEDKRRRNTAASARFRIKKKQREQALERHAKELEAKCANLESRINQLEMENKWLKNLVVEKNTGSAKEGIDGVLKGGFATTAGASSSSTKDGKDGVGVKSE